MSCMAVTSTHDNSLRGLLPRFMRLVCGLVLKLDSVFASARQDPSTTSTYSH